MRYMKQLLLAALASVFLVACSSGGDGVINTPYENKYDSITSAMDITAVIGVLGNPNTPGLCGTPNTWTIGTTPNDETITVTFDCTLPNTATFKSYSGTGGNVSHTKPNF